MYINSQESSAAFQKSISHLKFVPNFRGTTAL